MDALYKSTFTLLYFTYIGEYPDQKKRKICKFSYFIVSPLPCSITVKFILFMFINILVGKNCNGQIFPKFSNLTSAKITVGFEKNLQGAKMV